MAAEGGASAEGYTHRAPGFSGALCVVHGPRLSTEAGLLLHRRDDEKHEEEVADAAQKDKEMKNLVAAKAGIVPPWPLDCIEDAADGIEQSAA